MSNRTEIQPRKEGSPIVGLVVTIAAILFAHVVERYAAAEQPLSPQTRVISLSPGEILRPFNGRDLTGFSSWLQGIGTEDLNNVYSVVDSVSAGELAPKEDGVLRISGKGMGYLATTDSYKDYHLSLEYRWGEKTDGSGYVRNSGILLHANGPNGNAKGVWMASVECQLAQGCEGDLIVIRGKDATSEILPVTIASDTIVAEDGKTRWSSTGKKSVYSGNQFWWSRHQVGFKERLDTRGKDDVASPLGEWTRVDCLCQGDRITVKINGVTVNECYDVFPSSGKILLENEGNEIFFRNLKIRSLSKADR